MARKPASEMFETLREMADDLFGDDDEQKTNYITKHMQQLGYKARMVFEDADDDANDGSGGDFTSNLFGGGRQRREVRGRGDERGQRRAAGGGFGTNQYR